MKKWKQPTTSGIDLASTSAHRSVAFEAVSTAVAKGARTGSLYPLILKYRTVPIANALVVKSPALKAEGPVLRSTMNDAVVDRSSVFLLLFLLSRAFHAMKAPNKQVIYLHIYIWHIYIYVYMYICIYVYMYICIYVYMYTYICTCAYAVGTFAYHVACLLCRIIAVYTYMSTEMCRCSASSDLIIAAFIKKVSSLDRISKWPVD